MGREEDVPILAACFLPTTPAHSTRAAPELSMQLRIVCGKLSARFLALGDRNGVNWD